MKQINILLIEDVPEDIEFAEIQLHAIFGNNFTLVVSDYFSKAQKFLSQKTFDIILLDLSLPDSQGLTSFRKLIKTTAIPIIVYTGLDDKLIKSEALKAGASDYLIKGQTSNSTLKRSIINSIAHHPENKK